ncbi:MAG: asparagine synthetase B family protein [Marinilabiliaceae bacterium]|nr:asparagine synthetase B family protein [Marinilabiliaceae bacterium]
MNPTNTVHLPKPVKVKTAVIPVEQQFHLTSEVQAYDYREMAVFAAIGFFLGDATFYKNRKCLQPGMNYSLNEKRQVIKSDPYFQWQYEPRDLTLSQATEEFAHLYERLCNENLEGKNIILPLSGGLDSRSQAAAIIGYDNVLAYSYKFHNSFNETFYGKKIAAVMNCEFKEYVIQRGYLWNELDRLADINHCYTDFTAPRQMGIYDAFDGMGDIFFLGHWGDVLFDDMGVNEHLSFEQQVETVLKKIIKKGGLELGNALWQEWGLAGSLYQYLYGKVARLLEDIRIDNVNARIRVFKSMYWAPRWTSVSLNIFKSKHPVFLPYYHEEMCRFICTIPEKHLSARQIQIEYIKEKSPAMAKIPWQPYHPYNLYNYSRYSGIINTPRRAFNKTARLLKEQLLKHQPATTRNWEIQFMGKENQKRLSDYLFNRGKSDLISNALVQTFYNKFLSVSDPVRYAHGLNMLLVFRVFEERIAKGNH